REQQEGSAPFVRGAHRGDDLLLGAGGDEGGGRATDAHGRQRRQRDAVLGPGHQSSWTTARQRPRTFASPLVTLSSTVARRCSAARVGTVPETSMLLPPSCGTGTGRVKRVP